MSKGKKTSIVLASASPRRRKLLSEAGFTFDVCPSDIDESCFSTEGLDSRRFAEILALAKAKNVAQKHPDCLVIGADTVVDFEGCIVGKPDDEEHAKEITKKLFSKPHKVITAIALVRLNNGIEMVDSNVTSVLPRPLTPEQIKEHIESGNWKGKAGAYGIRECGDEFIERIEGSFTNVVGMPMELFARMLEKIDF